MVPECTSDVEAATRDQATPLGDNPLIVLSTSNSAPSYVDFQSKLAALSSDSKQVVAENSSHYIMIDRPELVISAIHDVVNAAQHHIKVNLKQPPPQYR